MDTIEAATDPVVARIPAAVREALRRGAVIPAHPLALDAQRRLDERRQRALTRYYMDAGAGGLAVGVHTTQFAIREHGLYAPVLKLAMELGYHAGLLSLAALRGCGVDEILAHCEVVAREIALVGFYLQPAVGGIELPAGFWEAFARLPQVVAIKIAPFHRYHTLEVLRGVAAARAEKRIALYTGNDDHIVLDLLTPFDVPREDGMVRLRFAGGLLGHWSVWTRRAVELLARCHAAAERDAVDADLLALDAGPGCAGDRLQRSLFRRRQRFCGLHCRLPRGAAPPGPARRHLVPGPDRRLKPWPGTGDRPRLPGPPRLERRRLRTRTSLALARRLMQPTAPQLPSTHTLKFGFLNPTTRTGDIP